MGQQVRGSPSNKGSGVDSLMQDVVRQGEQSLAFIWLPSHTKFGLAKQKKSGPFGIRVLVKNRPQM